MPIPKTLEEIFHDIKCTDGKEKKVYVEQSAIIWLIRNGAKIINDHVQIGGAWLTEVEVGKIIFTHSSKNKLTPRTR